MKIWRSVIVESLRGERVLVLLCRSLSEQERLHQYLMIDAFEFKKNIAESKPEIDFLSTGQLDDSGRIDWRDDLIDLPKWYDLN